MKLAKLNVVFKSVTVEPAMLLYFIALALTNICGQNLLLQKVCQPGDSVPPGETQCQNEVEAEKSVSQIQAWKQIVLLFVPVVFVLFAGHWSDSHGKRRKPLMLLPICGQIISDLLCILNIYFWSWSAEVAALTQSVIPVLTGWKSCFAVGLVCYLSDITTEQSRTLRLGICNAIYFLGSPIGFFLFGLLFRIIGYYGIFSMCVILNTFAASYMFFIVQENETEKCDVKLKAWEGLVNPKQIIQSLKTVFKARTGYRRPLVLLTTWLGPIVMGPFQGESIVLYLYLRYKFQYDETSYGYYDAYRMIVLCVGTVVTLGIFSKLLRISDGVIGIISSVTIIIASLGCAFCNTTWELFLFAWVNCMQASAMSAVSSILSKNVKNHELGQANSMIGVSDAVLPVLYLPIYSQVYNRTLTEMPGAFFLLSAVVGVILLGMFGVLCYLERMQRKVDAKKDHSESRRMLVNM